MRKTAQYDLMPKSKLPERRLYFPTAGGPVTPEQYREIIKEFSRI